MSIEQGALGAALDVADAAPGQWRANVARENVTVESAHTAVVCGASGCTREEQLLATHIDGFGQRILCPTHALDLIERESEKEQKELVTDGGEEVETEVEQGPTTRACQYCEGETGCETVDYYENTVWACSNCGALL